MWCSQFYRRVPTPNMSKNTQRATFLHCVGSIWQKTVFSPSSSSSSSFFFHFLKRKENWNKNVYAQLFIGVQWGYCSPSYHRISSIRSGKGAHQRLIRMADGLESKPFFASIGPTNLLYLLSSASRRHRCDSWGVKCRNGGRTRRTDQAAKGWTRTLPSMSIIILPVWAFIYCCWSSALVRVG